MTPNMFKEFELVSEKRENLGISIIVLVNFGISNMFFLSLTKQKGPQPRCDHESF